MKQLFPALILTFTLALAITASAADAPAPADQNKTATVKIGYVDINKIIDEHPISLDWDNELNKLKAERENAVKDEIKAKFGVTEESDLTDEQKLEVQKYIMMENEKFRQEMLPARNERLQKVEEDIVTYSAVIADQKGLDFILDRAAVIFGGTDITDDILNLVKQTPAGK